MTAWTAVILTGGRSTRLGHDKSEARVGGIRLLERVLAAVPQASAIVVVGGRQPVGLPAGSRWTCEDPPGGGPVAGLLAALPHVDTPAIVALATDLPFLGGLPQQLVDRLSRDADALVPRDAAGRDQPLCAAYWTDALRMAGAVLGEAHGASMRALLGTLRVERFRPAVDSVDPTMDVDTPADLARARGALMMQDWIDAVRLDLGTTGDLDIDEVLDVAKDVAHHVQRPAAPVTTYLLGLAVGSGMPLHEAAAKVRELATGWVGDK